MLVSVSGLLECLVDTFDVDRFSVVSNVDIVYNRELSFLLIIPRPPRSTQSRSSAASYGYK